MKDKKTICLSCGTAYNHKQNDGLCPACSAYNSADNTPEVFQGATNGVTPVKVVFENPTSIPQAPAVPPPAYARVASQKEVPAWLPIAFFAVAAVIVGLTLAVSAFRSTAFEQKNKSENVEVLTLSGAQDPKAKENYIDILGFKIEKLAVERSDMEGYIPVTVELVTFNDAYNASMNEEDYSFYLKCGDSYTTAEITGKDRMLVKGLNDESSFSLFYSDNSSIKLLFFIPENQFDSYTLCATQTQYEEYKYQEITKTMIEIPLEAPVQEDK